MASAVVRERSLEVDRASLSHADGPINATAEVRSAATSGGVAATISAGDPLPVLTSSDHPRIVNFLQELTNKELIDVCVALGLDYIRLANTNTDSLRQDMVHSWLRRDDNVLTESGPPTWGSLVRALELKGFNGVAATIRDAVHL